MALMNCPECTREVSDMAIACPHCGYPITQAEEIVANEEMEQKSSCPVLPDNSFIGRQVFRMANNPIITGVYDQSINRIDGIISGQVILTVHTHGIRMEHGLRGKFDIHNSQIIDINFMTAPTVEEINRSVITGAAIGGVLLGDIGAIVGGLTGLNPKTRLTIRQVLIVTFWDLDTRMPRTLLLECDANQQLQKFIDWQKREAEINQTTGRAPQKGRTLLFNVYIWFLILSVIIVLGCLIALFFIG